MFMCIFFVAAIVMGSLYFMVKDTTQFKRFSLWFDKLFLDPIEETPEGNFDLEKKDNLSTLY